MISNIPTQGLLVGLPGRFVLTLAIVQCADLLQRFRQPWREVFLLSGAAPDLLGFSILCESLLRLAQTAQRGTQMEMRQGVRIRELWIPSGKTLQLESRSR